MENKKLRLFLAVSLIALVASLATYIAANKEGITLGGAVPHYYYGAENSSSSVPTTATTTNPILSRDDSRNNAKVCYVSGTSTVFLHKSNISTTTGVVLNEGIPLYPTTTQAQICEEFPGFRGYLFGISANPAVVTVSDNN